MQLRTSAYAPLRMRELTWWCYARKASEAGLIIADGRLTASLIEGIESGLVAPMIELLASSVKNDESLSDEERGQVLGSSAARTMELRHWVPLIGQYLCSGDQIFDLGDELVEMLEQTEVSEATLTQLHLPYEALYLRFGRREHLHLPFGEASVEYLDGAFIARTPWKDGGTRLKFGFTSIHPDGSGVHMPGYFMDLLPEEQRLSVPQAIDAALERRQRGVTNPGGDADSNLVALDAWRREIVEESATALRKAAALLINALFYLESMRDREQVQEPGRDTPAEIAGEWAQSIPQRRRKLRSRLTREGYALVYLMGKEVMGARGARVGSEVSAHWRRGHWRDQPNEAGRRRARRVSSACGIKRRTERAAAA